MAPNSQLDPVRAWFRKFGLALTIVSAAFTGLFGLTMASNWLMAILLAGGLMCASVASAYVWPFVAESFATGNRAGIGTAVVLALFGVLVTGTDITTNFGSIAWQRGSNIETAATQNVRYDHAQDDVADLQSKKAMWEKRKEELEASKGWTGAKPSAAYTGDIATAEEAVRQEANRGGCGPKCLVLRQRLAELQANQATAKAHEDASAQLAATIKVLNGLREKASTVEKVESAALMQNTSLASVFTLSLQPTAEAQHWTDKGVNWMVAAFLAFGPMGFNFIGWGMPKRKREPSSQSDAPHRLIGGIKGGEATFWERYNRHCKGLNIEPVPA